MAETDLGDRFERNNFADFKALYAELIKADTQDGLDGLFQKEPEKIDIPMTLSVLKSGAVALEVTHSNGDRDAGSGWIVKREYVGDGQWKYWLMTNAHVIDQLKANEINRNLVLYKNNGQSAIIPIVSRIDVDYIRDVAAFTITTDQELSVLPVGNSQKISLGDHVQVALLGNQYGEGLVYIPGHINDPFDFAGEFIHPFIHHDAEAGPGVSGSALIDTRAATVIGLSKALLENPTSMSIQYALPIELAMESFEALSSHGKFVQSKPLDILYQPLSNTALSTLGLSETTGYYVNTTMPNGAADEAGFTGGDIILSYDGHPAPVSSEWQRMEYYISQQKPGSIIKFEVFNPSANDQEKKRIVTYKTELHFKAAREIWQAPDGLTVATLGEDTKADLAESLNLEPSDINGVQVIKGDETRGINTDDVIISIDGQPTPNLNVFRNFYERGIHGTSTTLDVIIPGEAPENMVVTRGGPQSVIENINGRKNFHLPPLDFSFSPLMDNDLEALGLDPETMSLYVKESLDFLAAPEDDLLFVGDVITGYNGKPIFTQGRHIPVLGPVVSLFTETDFFDFIEDAENGTSITFDVVRDGEKIKVQKTLGGLNSKEPQIINEGSPFEFLTWDLSAKARENLGLEPDSPGVLIGAPLNNPYGLKTGMVVTSINGHRIDSAEDLQERISAIRDHRQLLLIEVAGNTHWESPGYKQLLEINTHL